MINLSTLALAWIAGSFTFPGGTPQALSNTLQEATAQPVVIAADPTGKLRAATSDFASVSELKNRLVNFFRFAVSPGDALGFASPGWPKEVIASAYYPSNAAGKQEITISDVQDTSDSSGKITAKPGEGQSTTAGEIAKAQLAKPVDVFWIYQKTPVVLAAKNASETDVLGALAVALGSKLTTGTADQMAAQSTQQTSGYSIKFEPRSFQIRAVAGFTALAEQSQDPNLASIFQLDAAALRTLGLRQVTDLYKDPNSTVKVPVDENSAIYEAVIQRLQVAKTGPQTTPMRPATRRRTRPITTAPNLPGIDLRGATLQVELSANGRAAVQVLNQDGSLRMSL